MALAKKCDRCKKLYEHYPKGNKSQNNAVRRVCKIDNGTISSQDHTLDLYPECMSAFDKWMMEGLPND